MTRLVLAALGAAVTVTSTAAAQKPRARDLGVRFDGQPGALNAITDVPGVRVGHTTLVRGEGALRPGAGPVRTGVTVVFPRGDGGDPVYGGWFALNGNGEMTGTTWLEESGFLEGPVAVTNTHSVGIARDAVIAWQARRGPGAQPWGLPVVAETWDGWLNDINGFHVKEAHVFEALDAARGGPVDEGGVGGGTGMVAFELKGGIGTSSRRLDSRHGGYTLGVLVQANFGLRRQLTVVGVPVGREIPEGTFRDDEAGSVIVVVATDAPLLPHQLDRLARRVALGLARTGSGAMNGSGDLFVAFSTANPGTALAKTAVAATVLPNEAMNPLFTATVQATEEAVINALVAGRTTTGIDGHRVLGLPHDRLRAALAKYGRRQ
jgi:L-aminopeptidase/D-esterase-like protein